MAALVVNSPRQLYISFLGKSIKNFKHYIKNTNNLYSDVRVVSSVSAEWLIDVLVPVT